MDTIWALTSGEYSDYRVRVCFPDEATARAYLTALQTSTPESEDQYTNEYSDWEVASFTLLPTGATPEWITTWNVRHEDVLAQDSIKPKIWSYTQLDFEGEQLPRPKVNQGTTNGRGLWVAVVANTREVALHAYGEKVARLRANHARVASP